MTFFEKSLLFLFLIAGGIQLFYYTFFYFKFVFHNNKKKKITTSLPPVSVIICAKNEHDNLERKLSSFLEQDYPDYEVIVVDDNSDDGTENLLKEFAHYNKHFKYVLISGFNNKLGKKYPLSIGIKSAKNEILLLSDADCVPVSNQWIKEMVRNYVDGIDIVLGYGAYKKEKTLINKFVRFDTFFIALQYFSFSLRKLAYMGVGRNLSYKKQLFFDNKGFTSHYNVISGDDDLFINDVAKRNNVGIEYSINSHTVSEPMRKWSSLLYQKKRHVSTSYYYKMKHKILLGLSSLSHFVFYISFLFLLIINKNYDIFNIIIIIFVIRFIIQQIVFYMGMKKLNEKDLFYMGFLFDVSYIIINPLIFISTTLRKNNKWN